MVITSLLSYLLTLVILISVLWETAEALEVVEFENICIGLSAYIGAVLAASVTYNVALPKYSKKNREVIYLYNKSSIQVYGKL